MAPSTPKDSIILICLSGRGDKDVEEVIKYQEGMKKND
jgi:tryptophan synthase beta subunit